MISQVSELSTGIQKNHSVANLFGYTYTSQKIQLHVLCHGSYYVYNIENEQEVMNILIIQTIRSI
jgi:hypothetical protein